jgi:hypothetical protein
MSIDRVYYGTDTRLGEILVGVALAGLVHDRSLGPRSSRAVSAAGALGAAGLVALVIGAREGSPWVAHGILALTAVASTMVVAAAATTGSWDRIGSNRVVSWVGRASYGIYLVHWPVILVARHEGWSTDHWLPAIAIAAVVAVVAAASLRWLELPVRAHRWPTAVVAGAGAVVGIMVVAAAVAAAPAPTPGDSLLASLDAAVARDAAAIPGAPAPAPVPRAAGASAGAPGSTAPPTLVAVTTGGATPTLATATTDAAVTTIAAAASAPTAPAAPTMRFFGDSILLSLELALPTDAGLTARPVPGDVQLGCGVVAFVEPPNAAPIVSCADRGAQWATSWAPHPADDAVIMSCQWEAVDRVVPAAGGSRVRATIADAPFDVYVGDAYRRLVRSLLDAGAQHVLWVTCPHFSDQVGVDGLGPRLAASRRPGRVDALNALSRSVVGEFPGRACLVDLASWVDQRVDDAGIRPDGAHFEWRHDTGAGERFAAALRDALARCG